MLLDGLTGRGRQHSLLSLFAASFLLIATCAGQSPVRTNGASNVWTKHGNYVAFQNPPFDKLTRFPNGSFTYSGTSSKAVEWLAARHHFTYNVIAVNQTLEEKLGTHEAVFYQLANDPDVDGILCSFYVTLERKEKLDFSSFPMWYEVFRLVVPAAGEENRLFAFIGPFQPTVWLLILITLSATVCMMTIFASFYNKYYNSSRSKVPIETNHETNNGLKEAHSIPPDRGVADNLFSSMVYVTNIITNHGCSGTVRHQRFSFRILIGFFLLGAMVLVNCYSGIVISSLTVPKMKASIDSLEDLANSQEVDVLLRSDVSTGEQILSATSGIYKVLGDKARRHPDEQILRDPVKLNAKLETGRYAYPFVQTFTYFFVANEYKKDGRCRFKVSKPLSTSPGYYYWAFKKGDPQAQIYNKGLMDFFESGLLRFWAKSVIPRADECFATKKQSTSARLVPIRLVDLTSAFLILGVGLGLAVLTFLLEQIYSRILSYA